MTSIPESIKVLQLQSNRTVKVVDIPFASQDLVKNIPEDQVIIRVRAVGLNPTDWKHALGEWGTPGTISGCDSAGDVVKVGSAVKHLKVGDRAAGFTFGGSHQTGNGSFSEYVRFVAAVCFKVPESMTYEEAASFPIPHLTAVQALYIRLNLPRPLHPGPKREWILIWGGSTAVGHHAVQLAALSGLRVLVTASSAVHDELKALGAEACFDYKDADLVEKIRKAAGEEGISYALDTACDKGSTEIAIDAFPPRGGRVITILPISEEIQKRRKEVPAEFTLVYTEVGFALKFAHVLDLPAMPEDKAGTLDYVANYLPPLLEGWKAGQGSSKLRPQKLRQLEGGLERITEGLEIMKAGSYGREKLVYAIA
ncbi:hypothetical protein D9757_003821 [Collybiopsis confluens]|uniref:Enoyl reductase (ER) domain-containing protein n=1 Tax=Collybiopsis confluens TaxID=2823264 RepID=A0A8H5MD66_9AGAR|nr:hypothetical protein D9757_003821 [Collybiopsis confluens]